MNIKNKKSNKTYLLSYPRSSNTWIRYIIEYLTKQSTAGIPNNPDDKPIYQNKCKYLTHVDGKKPFIIYKTHGERWFRDMKHSKQDRLILITREPSTVIKKHHGKITLSGLRNYRLILEEYHKWKGEKIHLTFEDMMKSPSYFIRNMIYFLDNNVNVSSKRTDEFLENIEKYKKDSQGLYDKMQSGYREKSKTTKKVTRLDEFLVKAYFFLKGKRYLLDMIEKDFKKQQLYCL